MKKLTLILVAVMILLSVGASCKKDNKSGSELKAAANSTELDYKPDDTETPLVSSGKSEYKIVVDKNYAKDEDVSFAAGELEMFIEKATGASLPVIADTGLTFNRDGKYIVLGVNAVSKSSGMNLTYDEFGEDGFYIKTIGKTVLINSVLSGGAKYGVYEFLYYNFGIRVYGYDAMKIPDSTNKIVYLKNFDYKRIPDFAERTNGVNERYDKATAFRLGWNHGHGENWYAWCHTHFELMPKDIYFSEHRDWYSPDATQLCLTNDEMIAELTNVMKSRIDNSQFRLSQPGYFQLGHEDTSTFCDCDRCKAATVRCGGVSGVMMTFMNKVARIMNPWVHENYPEARIKWVTFAYGKTVDPPTKQLSDGTFVPFSDEVKAEENVGIMLAPLGLDWAHGTTDVKHNEKYERFVRGWKAMDMETYVYSYCVIFDDWFLYMDNWSTVKDQFQIWVDMKAQYMFEQGGNKANFYELTNYVHGKLLWDVDSDVEYYINDFMQNYYMAAAPFVYKYLNSVRTRYKLIERSLNANGENFRLLSFIRSAPEMKSEEYWPMDWLLSSIDLFDKALAECEKMPDGEDKDKAIKRVKAERLTPIAMLMNLYKFSLSTSDVAYYVKEFIEGAELNGITTSSYYDLNINDMIDEWRALLND